jgi:hypothetical protein
VSGVDDYFLAEFNKSQIVEAILRPASVEDIHGYGRPGDHYKFKYEEGLPEKIAEALLCSDVSCANHTPWNGSTRGSTLT